MDDKPWQRYLFGVFVGQEKVARSGWFHLDCRAMADNGFRKQSSQDEEKVSPYDDLFGLTQVGSVDFRHHLFDASFFHQVRQVIGIFLVAIGYHNFRQDFSDFWKIFHFCINFGKNTEFFPFS